MNQTIPNFIRDKGLDLPARPDGVLFVNDPVTRMEPIYNFGVQLRIVDEGPVEPPHAIMALQDLPAIAVSDQDIARITGDEAVQIMCIERVELLLNRTHLWHNRIVATVRGLADELALTE